MQGDGVYYDDDELEDDDSQQQIDDQENFSDRGLDGEKHDTKNEKRRTHLSRTTREESTIYKLNYLKDTNHKIKLNMKHQYMT